MLKALTAGCVLSCLLAVPVVAAENERDDPADEPKKTYQLPEDPKVVVISLDYQGGFTPPRIGHAPTMSIHADGTVKIPKNYEGQQEFSGKLSAAELQELLDFIIRKNEFFDYDADVVEEKLAKRNGPRLRVADAATTVIRVTADGKTQEASRYALGINAEIEELQQLEAIRQRLEKLRSIIQIGGTEAAQKWVTIANQHLKAQHPDVKPLGLEDLQGGGTRANGSIYVSFNRTTPGQKGEPPRAFTNVTINRTPEGTDHVNVVHREN